MAIPMSRNFQLQVRMGDKWVEMRRVLRQQRYGKMIVNLLLYRRRRVWLYLLHLLHRLGLYVDTTLTLGNAARATTISFSPPESS